MWPISWGERGGVILRSPVALNNRIWNNIDTRIAHRNLMLTSYHQVEASRRYTSFPRRPVMRDWSNSTITDATRYNINIWLNSKQPWSHYTIEDKRTALSLSDVDATLHERSSWLPQIQLRITHEIKQNLMVLSHRHTMNNIRTAILKRNIAYPRP